MEKRSPIDPVKGLTLGMGLAAALFAGAAGCAHEEGLVPAPQAAVVPSDPRLAFDQKQDVSVWVDGDAWRGHPADLEKVMTPIWVTIQNRGRNPVRITYKDFTLRHPSGVRVTPLPPFSMRAAGPERVRPVHVPSFSHHGFFIAPSYRWYYPGLQAWHRPLPFDAHFYDTYYARWRVALPTEDMLHRALPEGVLEGGGSVSGFLYFPDVPKDARGVFTFRADLSADEDGQKVASLGVPLTPK